MTSATRFLVVEDDADGEFLLERALLKRFPRATVCLFRDSDDAVAAASVGTWTGCVVHRALDLDGIEMVRRLRSVRHELPIVMVSGRDQNAAAVGAGANAFLRYTDWQLLAGLFPGTG